MAQGFEHFCTYHIFRWLTGDEILRKRYLEICTDDKLCLDIRIGLLKNFVKEVRDHLVESIKWDELIERGRKIENAATKRVNKT